MQSDDHVEAVDPEVETAPVAPRHRRRRRRRVLIALGVAVLLVAGGGVTAWALLRDGAAATTSYRTTTVATQTLKSTVSGTGSLQPAREAELGFASAGTVTAVDVAVGDTVTKGQRLATMDDDALQIALTQAEATLSESEAALTEAEADSTTTAVALAAAKAKVAADESDVTAAKAALAGATLEAPFAGTVAVVGLSKGDSTGASGGGASTGGTTGAGQTTGASSSASSATITVISAGTFTVDTSVSTADVGSIKKGMQATITPTGGTDPVFGTVSSVGVVASNSSSSNGSGSTTFPVSIKVTGRHTDLLPGSSVTVQITTKQLSDVIAVPTMAITTTDRRTTVRKLVAGEQVVTDVTLGQVLGNQTVITAGLADGDQVVVVSFTAQPGSGASAGSQNGQGFPAGGPPGGFGGGQGGAPGTGQGGGQAGGGTR